MTSRNPSSRSINTYPPSPHVVIHPFLPIIITPSGHARDDAKVSKEPIPSSSRLPSSGDSIFIPPTSPPSPGFCPTKFAQFSVETHLTSHPAQFGPQDASDLVKDAHSDDDEDSDEAESDESDSVEEDTDSDEDSFSEDIASANQEPPPPPVDRFEGMSVRSYALPSRRTPSPQPSFSYPDEDRTSRWVSSQRGSNNASPAGRRSPLQGEGYRRPIDARPFLGASKDFAYPTHHLKVPTFPSYPLMSPPPFPGNSRQPKDPYLSPDRGRPLRRPSPASSRTSRSSNKLGPIAYSEMEWFD